MMGPNERLVLAIEVLDRERNAHKVLADLIEEDGDRGLADWARARKSSAVKRLDFVLVAIPTPVAMRASVEFVGQAYSQKVTALFRSYLASVVNWTNNIWQGSSSDWIRNDWNLVKKKYAAIDLPELFRQVVGDGADEPLRRFGQFRVPDVLGSHQRAATIAHRLWVGRNESGLSEFRRHRQEFARAIRTTTHEARSLAEILTQIKKSGWRAMLRQPNNHLYLKQQIADLKKTLESYIAD